MALSSGVAAAGDDGGDDPADPEPPQLASAEAPEFTVDDLEPGYYERTPLPVEGRVMYYNPGVMERVLEFRLRAKHVTECATCIGYAAMLRAGDLDRRVWLEREGHLAEGPFWVIDVAAPQHVGQLINRNWIVDVDYETAIRWRMNRPLPVKVYADPPPHAFMSAVSLPLHWQADPVPAENFRWPPASQPYHGEAADLQRSQALTN
jgi:hypothetical protein